jgi:hypothetical protein
MGRLLPDAERLKGAYSASSTSDRVRPASVVGSGARLDIQMSVLSSKRPSRDCRYGWSYLVGALADDGI